MDWFQFDTFTLCGIILMLVIGPAVGNYACSVVYRLPRGQTPFERHPFCGHCNANLKPIDLFPILSWCLTRGRCRYCTGPIPAVYTVIEALCGIVFIAYFLHFGISELFLLYTAYAVFVIILAAIHWQQGWISATIYSYALAAIALARTLTEHTIYGTLQSGFVMLVIMLFLWRLGRALHRATPSPIDGGKMGWGTNVSTDETLEIIAPPVPSNSARSRGEGNPFHKPWIWWFTLLGAVVPFASWHYIAIIYAMKLLTPKETRVFVYTAGALILPLVL